jgi:hypothetical protein
MHISHHSPHRATTCPPTMLPGGCGPRGGAPCTARAVNRPPVPVRRMTQVRQESAAHPALAALAAARTRPVRRGGTFGRATHWRELSGPHHRCPLQASAPITQHGNPRERTSDAERVQMVWRSSCMRCSRDGNAGPDGWHLGLPAFAGRRRFRASGPLPGGPRSCAGAAVGTRIA